MFQIAIAKTSLIRILEEHLKTTTALIIKKLRRSMCLIILSIRENISKQVMMTCLRSWRVNICSIKRHQKLLQDKRQRQWYRNTREQIINS